MSGRQGGGLFEVLDAMSVTGQVLPPQTVVFLLLIRLHPLRRKATKDKRPFGPVNLLSTTFTVLGGVLTLHSSGFSTWKITSSERIFSASSQNEIWQLMLNWQQAAAEPSAHHLTGLKITQLLSPYRNLLKFIQHPTHLKHSFSFLWVKLCWLRCFYCSVGEKHSVPTSMQLECQPQVCSLNTMNNCNHKWNISGLKFKRKCFEIKTHIRSCLYWVSIRSFDLALLIDSSIHHSESVSG